MSDFTAVHSASTGTKWRHQDGRECITQLSPDKSEFWACVYDHYGRPAGQVFETAGLCFYRTGDDSVAWHGDRVGRAIDRDTMVAIVSVGAERTLSVRPKEAGDVPRETLRFPVGHGDLVVMGGSCQRTHEHAVLKTKQAVGPRISVQFRPVWAS